MDSSRSAGPTMTATDTRENGMSLTEPPRSTGVATEPPQRGRGERLAVIAGIVVTVVALTGIGFVLLGDGNGDGQPAPPAPTPAAQATTAPTVEPPPQTPADIAAAGAQERYLDYLRVTDQVANGGHTDLAAYDTIAIDPETGVLLQGAAQRAGKITTTGETRVVSLTVQSVELDPPGDYPSVRLLACLDVSQLTAVDAATGEPVAPPDFPDRIKSEVLVQDIPPGAFTDGRQPGWYVAEVVQRGEPC
jgi:hypothetical protein